MRREWGVSIHCVCDLSLMLHRMSVISYIFEDLQKAQVSWFRLRQEGVKRLAAHIYATGEPFQFNLLASNVRPLCLSLEFSYSFLH